MINKRIAAAGLAGSVIVMSVAAQAKTVEVKSDGCVDLTGEGAAENSVVTVELVSDVYDLSDNSTWASFTDDGTATGFMGAVTADENGKYEFNIYLKKSGRYTVRLGNSNFDGIKEEKLWFVNKDAMAKKLTELKEAAKTDNVSAIKDVLQSNRFDIGLFAKVGDDADYEKAAEALAAYLKNNQTAVTEDNISVIGEKACVISLLGNENFGGFSKYADGFGLGNLKVSKYYKDA